MFDTRHRDASPARAPARYIRDHWAGRQGLAWSFWVNLVALRILVFALQGHVFPQASGAGPDDRAAVIGAIVVLHGLVFLWQVVGVVRACETHIRAGGAMQPVWGVQLALIVAALWTLFFAYSAWPRSLTAHDAVPGHSLRGTARAAPYSLTVLPDGRALAVDGPFELGITEALERTLAAEPGVAEIALTSTGGNIYAARGLARVIREHGLDTSVPTLCSSACTLAFVGGVERRLAPGARLGFHQYRLDARYPVLSSDPAREQARDRAIFRAAGVADWFIDRMFETAASGMWYPKPTLLHAAGVVTVPPVADPDADPAPSAR